jgi:hypothetical protein
MLLAASNRQWATAGTVFSEARSRGIIAGMGEIESCAEGDFPVCLFYQE